MMTLTSTRILVQISIEDDTGNIAALILALTTLAELLFTAARFVNFITFWVKDFAEAVRFVTIVFSIGCRSLAWGFVGVRI